MKIALAGEALIDFTGLGNMSFSGHCGGSSLNTAIACARLGQATGCITQLSNDMFGDQLWQHMVSNGVDTRFVQRGKGSSTIAFVERGPQTNRYAFYSLGSADSAWSPAPLPRLPESCHFLHFGSISLLQDPAARRITELVAANAGQRVIVFDPNVRLSLIEDLPNYRLRINRWLNYTNLLKLSDEDVEALLPGVSHTQAAETWLQAGPSAVVITCGAQGATLYRQGHAPIPVQPPKIKMVDTIGAGDTFTAGLSVALLQQGVTNSAELNQLSDPAWLEVLQFAATAAALNCTREGANPPSLDEVKAALSDG